MSSICRVTRSLWRAVFGLWLLSSCDKGKTSEARPSPLSQGGASASATTTARGGAVNTASMVSGIGGAAIPPTIGGSPIATSATGAGSTNVPTPVGGSSGSTGAGTGGSQASGQGPTPYTVFMHDGAYGNIKIGALAVDETHVYFSENGGNLLRRRIDGSDQAVRFARWTSTALGGEIALDKDYVYWLDGGELVRVSKSGGETESFPLGGGKGDVLATESYVYAATDGCLTITRIAHGLLDKEVISAPADVTSPGGGFTFLLLDGTDLYCANGPRIFVSQNWGQLELLTADAGQPVVGLGVVEGELYWMSGLSPLSLFRYGKGSKNTLLGSVDYSLISRYIFADPPRKRVLFTTGGSVSSMSTETGEWKKVAVCDNQGYAVTRDSNYIYWGRQAYTEASIERMPITQE